MHATARIDVDRHTRREWLLVASLVTLSMLDLVLTVRHLDLGGAELNPLMAWSLEEGGFALFVLAKVALTSAGATFLLIHARLPLARAGLAASVALYGAVLAWHAVVAAWA